MAETINARLSHWAALRTCYCGRWTHQSSPERSPAALCYERQEQTNGPYTRTWRASGAGRERTYEWTGPEHCEVCGYDLTRSPRANLAALTAEDWAAGIIVGSDFGHEELADILPEGVAIEFRGCNLNNVLLGETHTMTGATEHERAVPCSNDRIRQETDGHDWVCRWQADGNKPADSPVRPVDLLGALLEGRITDPADLPAEPMTEAELNADRAARQEWLAEVADGKVDIAKRGYTQCTCVAEWATEAEVLLNPAAEEQPAKRKHSGKHAKHLPPGRALPRRNCPLCGGIGAIPPERGV